MSVQVVGGDAAEPLGSKATVITAARIAINDFRPKATAQATRTVPRQLRTPLLADLQRPRLVQAHAGRSLKR
jgi:hypothetical protein